MEELIFEILTWIIMVIGVVLILIGIRINDDQLFAILHLLVGIGLILASELMLESFFSTGVIPLVKHFLGGG